MAATAVAIPQGGAVQAADIKLKDITGHPDEGAINALIQKGMINGYPDGTFKPERQLTRYDITLIIGRYLVQLGYSLPTDVKTNMRFNDLNRYSDIDLLSYAALLADIGILQGDLQKRLNPNEQLTREQLALVLTRAFSIIDEFDYANHVKSQSFVREYLDIANLPEQSRLAIEVLDFYSIVDDRNYFPKEIATRGQFASMTYKMMQVKEQYAAVNLQVKNINVVSETRLKVTLSDDSIHFVQLSTPLKDNVLTEVKFQLKGRYFTEKVTYVKEQLRVTHVESINSGQFEIHFNQEVDLMDAYHDRLGYTTDISKIVTLVDEDGRKVSLQKGELTEDKLSLIVTINGKTPLAGTYNLMVNGIHAVNGSSIARYDDSFHFYEDENNPKVADIERVNSNIFNIKFTEPIYAGSTGLIFKYGNEIVSDVKLYYQDELWSGARNATELKIDLSNAKYRKTLKLPPNAKLEVSFTGLRDLALNRMQLSDTIVINRQQTDQNAPRLEKIEQVGAKKFKLTFNESMSQVYPYQLLVSSATSDYFVEDVSHLNEEGKTFIVTVDEFLQGYVTIQTDANFKVKDASGTEGAFNRTVRFEYEETPAQIVNTRVIRENNIEYLTVEFDQNIELAANSTVRLEGRYKLNNATYEMYSANAVKVYPVTGDSKALKVPLNELLFKYDREKAQYDVELLFEHVYTDYLDSITPSKVSFVRTKDYNYNGEKLELLAVDTSRTSKNITENNLVTLTFNLPVNKKLAENIEHYDFGEMAIESIQVDPYQSNVVQIRVKSNSTKPFEEHIYIYNLQADNSVAVMDPYYEIAYFNEIIAPKYRDYQISGDREIKLSFTEVLQSVQDDTFVVFDSKGNVLATTTANDKTNSSNLVLTFDEPLPTDEAITIRLQPNRSLYDVYGNKGDFTQLKIEL